MIFTFRIRYIRFLVGLFLLIKATGVAHGQETAASDFWFSHAIVAVQNGNPTEVIGVKGTKPQILNKKGKESTVSSTSQSGLIRSEVFHEGYVVVNRLYGDAYSTMTVTQDGVKLNNLGDGYHASPDNFELIADRDIEDCYIVLIFISDEGHDKPSSYTLGFKSLGNLQAGKKKKISIFPPSLPSWALDIVPAVFSHGKEIHTNMSSEVAKQARTLKQRDHRNKVSRYLAESQGQNRPARCVYYPFPHMKIQEGDASNDFPSEVSVVCSLDSEGNATAGNIDPQLSPTALLVVRAIYREWLFLPEVRNGTAVPTIIKMVVPLRAEMARAAAAFKKD